MNFILRSELACIIAGKLSRMKNRISVLLVSSLALMLCHCKSKKEAAVPTTNTEKREVIKGDPKRTLDIDNSYVWPGSTDPFKVLSAQISDQDSLIVEVEYGGGCKDHEFRLVTNGNLKKSMPAQGTLYLEHESNDDMCRALIRQKLAFFIGNLAKNGETIIIQLNDYNPESGRLILNPGK
ncbi:MAG: hypothetical protein RLZZ262_1013 [Bacteroidota bacterium]|jgi:hypothetical protein